MGQSEPAPISAPVGRSVHTMGCISSFGFWPVLSQHCTTVNLFGLLTFDPFYFLSVFPTLSILPSNLITLVP